MSTRLEYEIGQGDLEAFFAHHAAHAPHVVSRVRRMRRFWGGLFAFLALAYSLWSPAGTVAFLALAVVVLVFYGPLNRWWYVRHSRRLGAEPDSPGLGHTTLELDEGRLLVEVPEGFSSLRLSAVRRIDESDSHYFLYLGPVQAIIVPKGDRTGDFVRALRAAGAAS